MVWREKGSKEECRDETGMSEWSKSKRGSGDIGLDSTEGALRGREWKDSMAAGKGAC